MTYFEDIKRLRAEQKVTQAELAKRADVSREYFIKVESGDEEVKVSAIRRIAKALGKKVMVIFYE